MKSSPTSKYATCFGKRLGPEQVGRIIKGLTVDAKLPMTDKVSIHSCRSGFTTSLARKGKPLYVLQRHGCWKDLKTVIGYIEQGRQFEDNVAKALF